MNGKKAKRLRSEARSLTKGLPLTKYEGKFTVVLSKACTRKKYLELKRAAK
jgi:hypothetical protein